MAVPAGAVYIGGVACTPDGAVYVTPTGTAAITGGTIMGGTLVGGPSQILAKSAIPFVKAPTGSMANNGAVTLGTALGRTYAKCFMYFPAGAIATSVPAAAAWLYTEMSSTTVGIVYNNTYTSGVPAIPSKTAFVTTGPGAFTGVITEVTGPQFTMAGGVMGANGQILNESFWSYPNTAGAKIPKTTFGGSQVFGPSRSTNLSSDMLCKIANQGDVAIQIFTAKEITGAGGAGAGNTGATIATGSNVTLAHTFTTSGAATDYLVLEQTLWLLCADGT